MSDTVSRAAVLVAPERLELQDFPVPGVGDDDAILRVEAAGICGSDWAQYQGTLTAMPAVYPIIPGHEIAGHDPRASARRRPSAGACGRATWWSSA